LIDDITNNKKFNPYQQTVRYTSLNNDNLHGGSSPNKNEGSSPQKHISFEDKPT